MRGLGVGVVVCCLAVSAPAFADGRATDNGQNGQFSNERPASNETAQTGPRHSPSGGKACVVDSSALTTCPPPPWFYYPQLDAICMSIPGPAPDIYLPRNEDGEPDREGYPYAMECKQGVGGASTVVPRAAPPPPPPPPAEDVAARLIENTPMSPISIGRTPNEGNRGLLGLPTWLWVDSNRAAEYRGPSQKRVVERWERGIGVRAYGYVDKIVWTLGDGTTKTCRNAGTKFTTSSSGRSPSGCDHVYREDSGNQAGGRYRITAQTFWVWDWEEIGGLGRIGQLRVNSNTASRSLRIVENQVLVR